MKFTLLRLKQSSFLSSLLILGLMTSILLISIGTSFVSNLVYGQNAKEDNAPPNGEMYDMTINDMKNYDGNTYNKFFSGIDKKTGLFLNDLLFHIDGSDVNVYNQASGEYFVDENVWHFPLVRGEYYTVDDVKKGNKVVLIGASLEDNAYKKNNKEYIKIEGEEYIVKGILGFENQASQWDRRMVMPCTAFPKSYFEKAINDKYDTLIYVIYREDGDYSKDITTITNRVEKIFNNVVVNCDGPIYSESVLNQVAVNPDKILLIALVGYIVTLILSINITVFWMENRRYEISLRKAMGFSNGSIVKMIFGEMMGFVFIAFVLALLLQLVLNAVMGSIVDYVLKIYLPNLLVGIAVVFITSAITSVLPVAKAIKVQPAEVLKEKRG